MIQARVRKMPKYNNLKRKLHGCIRMPDNFIGKTLVILSYPEYITITKVAKEALKRLNKIRKLL